MLRSIKELQGYTIQAVDGEIGEVQAFYFDDERWTVRYLVVDTGPWLFGRQVLISPAAIEEPDWERSRLWVHLTKEQVESSPEIDLDEPVSRQQEKELHTYYGWPAYWLGPWPGAVGPAPTPVSPAAPVPLETEDKPEGDPHLRSSDEVIGYSIRAQDGEVGHVTDFLVDDASWAIRYMVIDTGDWLPGRKVVVPPAWIKSIDWSTQDVVVDLTRDEIERSPEYIPETPLRRRYEEELYDHYGRQPYWEFTGESR